MGRKSLGLKGLCVVAECRKALTLETASQSVTKSGNGRCRVCQVKHNKNWNENNRERFLSRTKARYQRTKKEYAEYAKVHHLSVRYRHVRLRGVLRKEEISTEDPLYSINFYESFLRDNCCHYCSGPLSAQGINLDRVDNSGLHTCFNVVPCCRECNRIKGPVLFYDEMMLLSPILKEIRIKKLRSSDG